MINIQKKWDTIYADVNLQKIALDYKIDQNTPFQQINLQKNFKELLK